ncbi:uncharacterized protein FA14DRAFT_18230 [Meira miltonrushii]|uniref:SMP-LTD domain-containing protein n=1 Tax=Meira miltonrushii TaxID=1280837 RepID=A0A316VMT8_9BASI|nr:uncharacterized protein FA14DRAFT_18230 [Meira miltonrushii]PWN37713.1 hypothetical protein FA14DRAFT_18230 [Meira miltonrushii]
MSILSTLAYYRTAVFYYIFGGITFLPLCAAVVFIHFWLTAPPYEAKSNVEDLGDVIGEGELSEERKKQALDLAIWNQKAEKEAEERKGKESEEESTSTAIPGAARRVNPPVPQKRPHRAGWLTVRRHFQNDGVNLALKDAAQQAAKKSNAQAAKAAAATANNGADAKSQGYMSSVYKSVLNFRNKDPAKGPLLDANRGRESPSDRPSGSSTPEQTPLDRPPTSISSTSKNSNNSLAAAQASAAKETFYCILKGPILYLYSSADPSNPETECHAAIDLRGKRISIFVAHEGDTMGEPIPESSSEAMSTNTSTDSIMAKRKDKGAQTSSSKRPTKRAFVRDGELFVKRNAIRIVSMGGAGMVTSEKVRFAEWFVFAKNAYQLEDWYHAFISASLLPEGLHADQELDLVGSVFSNEDMTNLLANLDNVPDPIPLRWLNAMVGRIFFSIYKTAWLEDYITHKFRKKISRVRTPGFLSDIRVREIDLGHTAPAFSRPMLKSLTGDGEASMEVSVHYRGSLRLTISTVLTISLGSRFKQYNVSLVLAVILNSLEGNLLLHIKPPPSNRLWFGFTKLPTMDISVEPVVSERKVQWSMVKRLIEGRIRELMTESLVVPNMDDIPFFDTRSFDQRGGIWSDAAKGAQKMDLDTVTNDEPTSLSADVDVQRQSKSTPASVLDMSTEDSTLGSSSAVDTNDGKYLRNRSMTGDASHSESALLSASPAAAGLSSLLARDQAASSGSTSTGAGKGPSKRRSWFVGRSHSPSRAPGGRKSNLQHSSLAWGSASLSTGDDALTHERNKPSISSSIGEQGNETDTSTAESQLDAHESDAYPESEQADPESQGDAFTRQDDIPAVQIHGMDIEGEGDEEDFNDAMFTAKAEHFNDSSEDTAMEHTQTPDIAPTPPPHVPPRPPIKTTGSSSFLPPPSRSARPSPVSSASVDQEQQRSPAMQSLASIQKERYSGTPTQAHTADEAHSRSAATQAALLHGWNKAKASMADRDSRQAAAKEAKDAFKRGWANWNAKRSGQGMSNAGVDTILTSSDRLGESGPSRSSTITTPSSETGWLASSPEDPASLGVGFDGHGLNTSPSILSLDNTRTHDETLTPTSSRASSVVGRRQPYREHRADRLKKDTEPTTSRPSSSASSIRSFDQSALQPPPVPARDNEVGESKQAMPNGGSIPAPYVAEGDAWDAETPSLTAPVPAAHRDSHTEARTNLSSSPVTARRSNAAVSGSPGSGTGVTLSSSADGQGKPSYFLPGQATATIGLSGVDLPSLPAHDTPSAQVTVPVRAKEGESSEIQRRGSGTSVSREPKVTSPDRRMSRTSIGAQELPQAGSPDGATTSPSMQPKGIKQQPIRATMMTVPGIPSMQKAGPQSFEAPKPVVEASPKGRTSNLSDQPLGGGGSPRLGLGDLMSRIPSFGTASTAGQSESIAAPLSENGGGPSAPPSVSSVSVQDNTVTPALNDVESIKEESEKSTTTKSLEGTDSALQSAVEGPSVEEVKDQEPKEDTTPSSKRPVPIPPTLPRRLSVAERLESTVKPAKTDDDDQSKDL